MPAAAFAAPYVDAHIHLANLSERDPGFPERLGKLISGSAIRLCASSHDPAEFAWIEKLRKELAGDGGSAFISSFGIHPQSPAMVNADLLSELAASGRIEVIGEAGFDFFADTPERVRNPENIAAQRQAFEFQLELAIEGRLPLLLHIRRGMDFLFEYSRRLALLPAAIFHSWSGTPGEGEALLRKGVPAFFSFGATILNGRKAAIESLRLLPAATLLSETDAPWQPPRGSPFCRLEHIEGIVAGMAAIRGAGVEAMKETIATNWRRAAGGGA